MPILQEIKVPLLSVNDTSLTVVDIVFAQNAAVKKGETVLVLETSKTTYDVVAEVDGFIGYTCEKDTDYEVNVIIAYIYSDASEVPATATPLAKVQTVDKKENAAAIIQTAAFDGETIFSASALALMEASNISKTIFAGKDFVNKVIVQEFLGIATPTITNNKKPTNKETKQLIPVDISKVIVEKLSINKKREIELLSTVQSTGLTSTIHTQVATEGIFVHINQSLQYLKNSLLPIIIYEASRLLLKYKVLNGYFTGDAIALYKEVNIGFAIDIDKGLKVVKIPAAAAQSISDIESGIMLLSGKYLDNTLHIDDLSDISFTITDLSAEGVAFFKPLVNSMNSAILGVSAIDEKLSRCTLSLTFDHRVTEGKTAAQFLNELKQRLESYQSKHFPNAYQHISCFKCFKQLKDDLSDVGFSKCITPKGAEAYICQSCLKGF
jgi:pyruvate/2-oxoglutarate dehydrogenase complex dihydrolipoamide acyltransferase (E2) component